MPDLYIPPGAWEAAEEHFKSKKNQKDVKFQFGDQYAGNECTFIFVEDTIYAKQTKDCLGKGGFGKVQVVQNQQGQQFAVKVQGKGAKSEKNAELEVLDLLGKYHGQAVRSKRKKTYTIMDLEQGQELEKFLKENADPGNTYVDISDFSKAQNLHVAFMCLQTLSQVHAHGIIHGDVKPGNFMINFNEEMIAVAAIDFGLSLVVKPGEDSHAVKSKVPLGTPGYTAPEIVFPKGRENTPQKNIVQDAQKNIEYDKSNCNRVFTFASDVYSLGVMFRDDLNLPKEIYEPMLETDPTNRPSVSECMKTLAQELKKQKSFDLRPDQFKKNVMNNQALKKVELLIQKYDIIDPAAKEVAEHLKDTCIQIKNNGDEIKLDEAMDQVISELDNDKHQKAANSIQADLKLDDSPKKRRTL